MKHQCVGNWITYKNAYSSPPGLETSFPVEFIPSPTHYIGQLVIVSWKLDGEIQEEIGVIAGMAYDQPDFSPGWWYLVHRLDTNDITSKDWFDVNQVRAATRPGVVGGKPHSSPVPPPVNPLL